MGPPTATGPAVSEKATWESWQIEVHCPPALRSGLGDLYSSPRTNATTQPHHSGPSCWPRHNTLEIRRRWLWVLTSCFHLGSFHPVKYQPTLQIPMGQGALVNLCRELKSHPSLLLVLAAPTWEGKHRSGHETAPLSTAQRLMHNTACSGTNWGTAWR